MSVARKCGASPRWPCRGELAQIFHEPTAARVGARASWTAATESSESPLWFAIAVLAARFGHLELGWSQSGDFADSVTAVQNLRQIPRFMESIMLKNLIPIA